MSCFVPETGGGVGPGLYGEVAGWAVFSGGVADELATGTGVGSAGRLWAHAAINRQPPNRTSELSRLSCMSKVCPSFFRVSIEKITFCPFSHASLSVRFCVGQASRLTCSISINLILHRLLYCYRPCDRIGLIAKSKNSRTATVVSLDCSTIPFVLRTPSSRDARCSLCTKGKKAECPQEQAAEKADDRVRSPYWQGLWSPSFGQIGVDQIP